MSLMTNDIENLFTCLYASCICMFFGDISFQMFYIMGTRLLSNACFENILLSCGLFLHSLIEFLMYKNLILMKSNYLYFFFFCL